MAGQGAELVSVITDYGEHASTCGYCGTRKSGGAKGSVSHGMMAERLSVEVYQQLLDRGWRRSGRWVYYPLHESSCCQLLTIRLDVTKFQPNKDQRRVQRRWQAYLDGAPLRTQQHVQQPADAAQQQQQQGGGGGGSEWQQQDFGAAVSRSDDVAGGSPKRMHEELEPQGPSPGQLPAAAAGSLLQANGLEGGGKRHRHGAEDADAEDGETARGASPAAQLSQHLQQALGSAAMAVDSPRQQPTEQQQQQAGAAQPSTAAAAEAGGTPAAELAAQLAAALQQAVAAGELPAAAYPPPKVQQPSARQRKLLPPGVTLTSAFPLAVAAAAAKAAATAGSGSSAAADADAVAALLVRHLLPAVAAAAEVAKGHLNFALAAAGTSEAAAAAATAAAGDGAVNSSKQKGAQQAQQSKKQQAQQAQQQQQAEHQQSQQQQAPQQQGIPRGVPRHFELRTLPSSDPSLVQAEFRLFKKYQVVHHGDKPGEVTQSSFRNFLIDSPLVHQGPDQLPQGGCPSTGFGSFHQQYWLDGVLVAVGVVDVLPRCLSSKYLFWDPDLGPLSLGKLTSLAEIEWVRREQAERCPSLRYYYLGFYIHNCHRMRYKGDFAPSDLLCPKNKCWVPLARVQSALEQPGMVAISELPGALAGLGAEHRVDAASGQATCPPRLPTAEELSEQQLQLHLPATRGGRQPRVFTLGQLRGAGMLRAGPAADQFAATLGKWWSRAGPAAASATAYAID